MRDDTRRLICKRIEALEKGFRQNIGLIGPQGFGKSSILQDVYSQFSKIKTFIPIYVNVRYLGFENFVDSWCGSILTGLFAGQQNQPYSNLPSLLQAADPIVPQTVAKIRQLKKVIRREKNTASIRELFSITGFLAEESGKKVILMIDEFQELQKLPTQDPFAVLGREIMVEKDTLYLVSSSSPIKANEIFHDKLSMLFGNFEVIELAPFGFERTALYLDNAMPGITFSRDQKSFMIRLTNGHPRYLQIITERIRESLNRQENRELEFSMDVSINVPKGKFIQAFHRELIDEGGRLYHFMNQKMLACRGIAKDYSPYLNAMLAITHGKRKTLAIAAHIEKKLSETKKILQRLMNEELIEKKGSFYTIEDTLFRFWLKEVFEAQSHIFEPSGRLLSEHLQNALLRQYEYSEIQNRKDLSVHLGRLFKEFRNDVLEVDHKKIRFPQFSEIAVHPDHGRNFPILAKGEKMRWICQVSRERVTEDDVVSFLDETKRFKKGTKKRMMFTLSGIDQNAKLLAQTSKIQLWDLRELNLMLDLYDLPKIIMLDQCVEAKKSSCPPKTKKTSVAVAINS